MSIAADITGISPSEPRLSFIHTTQVSAFREICEIGFVQCRHCSVMGKSLIYFFYGRAAYRPGSTTTTNTDQDRRPVCLLFRVAAIGKSYAVYPFDTGAHKKELYSPYTDGISFADLECSSVPQSDQRIVGRYYGDNDDYLYGYARPALDPMPKSSVAKAYHQLLTATGERKHDDRCLTVEIQSSANLTLDGALSAIVFPDFLTAEPPIRDKIEAWAAEGVTVHP